jgi:hypothetical protein
LSLHPIIFHLVLRALLLLPLHGASSLLGVGVCCVYRAWVCLLCLGILASLRRDLLLPFSVLRMYIHIYLVLILSASCSVCSCRSAVSILSRLRAIQRAHPHTERPVHETSVASPLSSRPGDLLGCSPGVVSLMPMPA